MKKLIICLLFLMAIQTFAEDINFKEIQKIVKKNINKKALIEEVVYEKDFSKIFDKKTKEVIRYYLITSPYGDDIKGYAGSTPVLIVTDKNKKIELIKLLENNETEAFVNIIESKGFFNSWNKMNINDILNKEIDTVVGATYTTAAIIENINRRVEMILIKKEEIIIK